MTAPTLRICFATLVALGAGSAFGFEARLQAQHVTPPIAARANEADSASVAASSTSSQHPAEHRPSVAISGITFGHYLYRTDDAASGMNRFDIERAELTAHGSVAERTRFRVSIDVVPPPPSVPGGAAVGWTMRARYAFLDQDIIRRGAGASLSGRIGMIHNVIIGHQETFWPRWIHKSPVDRAGYFSSSDLGAGLQFTLPNRWGVAYATVMNGPGIGSAEVDQYKDVAARLTLTPFAGVNTPFVRTMAVTGWGSDGRLGSRFATGGPGQVGPVDEEHRRDRWGIHAGVREPVFTAGIDWSARVDEVELGANTPEDPRRVEERRSELFSVHGHLRPARLFSPATDSPLGVLARWDRSTGVTASDFLLAGASWDLAPRTALALTYQTQQPRPGATVVRTDAWLLQFTFGF